MTEDEFVALVEMGIRTWAGRNEEDLLELGQGCSSRASPSPSSTMPGAW